MKFLILILLFSFILFFGCTGGHVTVIKTPVVQPPQGHLKPTPQAITGPDELQEPLYLQVAKIRGAGDEIVFPVNQPFDLDISLDKEKYDLIYTFDSVRQIGRIKVVELLKKKIITFNKICDCDTISVAQLSRIEIANNSGKNEQVVITPIFNNRQECILIGYEVRLGVIERGCQSDYIDLCKDCLKRGTPPPPTPRDWESILFGK